LVYPRTSDMRLSEHGASRSAGCEALLLGISFRMNVLPTCHVHIWTMWKLWSMNICKSSMCNWPWTAVLFSWRGCLGWEYKLENLYNLVYVNNKGHVTVALVWQYCTSLNGTTEIICSYVMLSNV